MRNFIHQLCLITGLALLELSVQAQEIPSDMSIPQGEKTEIATLAAGCFWCVEAVFQELEGVYKVESGYTNGHVKNPGYREVSSGTTGHAEAARITFNPDIISFDELLEVFWTTHDPTTLNRQGADRGTQYRSGIYYHNPQQRAIAERSKKEVATKLWSDPIVTEIEEAATFYVAEDYHQNYYKYNPEAGYCRVVINPKVQKLREKFADKLKSTQQ